jgi:hypothetical protein
MRSSFDKAILLIHPPSDSLNKERKCALAKLYFASQKTRLNPISNQQFLDRLPCDMQTIYVGSILGISEEEINELVTLNSESIVLEGFLDPLCHSNRDAKLRSKTLHKRGLKTLKVNGRGRLLEKGWIDWTAVLIRKILGKSLFVEILFSITFLLLTPLLLFFDLLRGKK